VAAAIVWVLLLTASAAGEQSVPAVLASVLIFWSLAVFVMIRFGLLALVANFAVYHILENFP